mmetsp:Transcript_3256/g.7907  ORF Transcript_3256/g.7907 Transcript_3256/m.7907 type:complete len:370 (-) Transcript_3256:304-1413(-)
MTVGWGIIGSSGWARSTFAPAIVAADNARLVAVLGTNAASVEAFKASVGDCKGYTDIAAFLADPEVKVVWIASSTRLHCEHALACRHAGKHVLVEKPLAARLDDAAAILAAYGGGSGRLTCSLPNVVLERSLHVASVGYHNRYNPSLQTLRRHIFDGRLGDILFLHVQFLFWHGPARDCPTERGRIEASTAHGGGFAIDWVGTHLLDIVGFLTGQVPLRLLSSTLSNRIFGLAADDHCTLVLAPGGGGGGTFVVTTSTGVGSDPSSLIEVHGTKSHVTLRNFFFGGGDLVVTPNGGSPQATAFAPVNLFEQQVRAVSAAVMGGAWGGGPEPCLPLDVIVPSLETSLENVRLLQIAKEATEHQGLYRKQV